MTNSNLLSLLFCSLILSPIFGQVSDEYRDGKLMKGEEWQPFNYPEKADFYVSPTGNDDWSGRLAIPNSGRTDGPFLTIERAQKAVLELKSKAYKPKEIPVQENYIGSPHVYGSGKDILVYIREGYYHLDKPLQFGPNDGGERVETDLPTGAFEYHRLRDHYVTYANYPNESPVISGAKPVHSWKKSNDYWIGSYDGDNADMFLVDGMNQVLARTPNDGFYVPPRISLETNELFFNSGDLKNWDNMEDNRVIMMLRWHTGVNSISRIDEAEKKAILTKPQEGVIVVPPRYYVENVKDFMDAPGEWYYDKKSKELNYIPKDGMLNLNNLNTVVPVLSNLISVIGKVDNPVRNLRFYGLTFEGTVSGGDVINFEYVHANELNDCEIRSCGGRGINVLSGCYQTRIMNNTFRNIENGGIIIKGPKNPLDGRAITRETLISHNKLYDCGGTNIHASYSLMTSISHNYITRPRGRYSIYVGGWGNLEEAIDGGYVVEYNHLDDVQGFSDDSGAISTGGVTFNSVIRRNLIHGVRKGYFNDNVAFWFDNMSLGWTSEENIYYDLEQGEWKLCAALLEDNIYRNNFKIESPKIEPELLIDGEPQFEESNIRIEADRRTSSGDIPSGSIITITADVKNIGSTGMSPILLYVDGKVKESKLFPVIKDNSRKVEFKIRIYEQGYHRIAIGSSHYKDIRVTGEKPDIAYEDFQVSFERFMRGEPVKASVLVRNLTFDSQTVSTKLFLGESEIRTQNVLIKGNDSLRIKFNFEAPIGVHSVRIGNSEERKIEVFGIREIDLSTTNIFDYCSAKAEPCVIETDNKTNRYKIKAGGMDFLHGEDGYGSAYVKNIKGDFIATVKINQFGSRTHEWFRAGLFVRNNISESFDVEPGSMGSVLLFSTPRAAGMNYDEFADGCMHKADHINLPEDSKAPIYLKLIRHGDSFSGYISLDGENWIIERHSPDIPEIGESIDLGLAAGGNDGRPYWVEFEDWKIQTAVH